MKSEEVEGEGDKAVERMERGGEGGENESGTTWPVGAWPVGLDLYNSIRIHPRHSSGNE